MDLFDLDHTLIGTGTIFPNSIEGRDWIAFHCTSTYYAPAIEANGFSSTKPIDPNDLALLQTLSKRCGVDTSGVDGFLALRTISFSPVAELALCYSDPATRGGQGLKFVNAVANELLTNHAPALDNQERARLNDILGLIATIQNSDAVIYAVDFQGLDKSMAHYDSVLKTIKATAALPPDRIVARLLIPGVVNCASINQTAHRERLQRIFWSPQRHFLKEMKA
ncbi:hypothetical protein LGN17_17865 [Burkholderia sp. AU30280]|uniref:hypothetical protein n=1 Tax=Burkholderia sp. AU30280 TaxID=2879628 RepID=UPI001CF235C5|nr:hypothetical protein [Burkholderia sp. AU30280]MCA8274362.1 hypothetical protein [Burkholderia sp. AU30280]